MRTKATAEERADTAERALRLNGFRECDIAACNCGSWHAGPNFRAERAERERDNARFELEMLDHKRIKDNEYLIGQRNALTADHAESEKSLIDSLIERTDECDGLTACIVRALEALDKHDSCQCDKYVIRARALLDEAASK